VRISGWENATSDDSDSIRRTSGSSAVSGSTPSSSAARHTRSASSALSAAAIRSRRLAVAGSSLIRSRYSDSSRSPSRSGSPGAVSAAGVRPSRNPRPSSIRASGWPAASARTRRDAVSGTWPRAAGSRSSRPAEQGGRAPSGGQDIPCTSGSGGRLPSAGSSARPGRADQPGRRWLNWGVRGRAGSGRGSGATRGARARDCQAASATSRRRIASTLSAAMPSEQRQLPTSA
jgi:hypothetical protein